MYCRTFRLALVLAALALAVVHGQDNAAEQESTQDQLVKHLAGVFMTKEGGNMDAAQNSMRVFQGVVNEEIFQVFHNKTRQTENIESIPQQLKEYFESQIVAPSKSYFHETLEQHLSGLKPNASTFEEIKNAPKPDLSYFKDPNQNPVGDLLKGFTPAGSSVGSVSGPDFITYAPCLVSNSPAGVALSAAAINFIPQLIGITPQGVGLFPSGIYIQPSVIYISPYGLYATPVGLNVAPNLITVAPYIDEANPAGLNVAPTGISVATPASPTRKLLAGEKPASSARKLQEGEAAADTASPAAAQHALPTDPAEVWLQSYAPWVALMSTIASQHGGADHEKASSFMSSTLEKASMRLKNWSHLNLTDLLPAGVSFTDPMFFDNEASNITSSSKGFSIASAFLNYAPCIIGNIPNGVAITAAGIEFSPTGILINPAGVQSQVSGINLQPTVILIEPTGGNYIPWGANISPTLLSITPALHVVGQQALNIADAGIAIDATTGAASGPWVAPKPSPSG